MAAILRHKAQAFVWRPFRLQRRPHGAVRTVFTPSDSDVERFRRDGFLVVPRLVPRGVVASLVARIEPLFRGEFDTGNYPDEWHWREGISMPNVTREMCNAYKSDRTVASVVLSSAIAAAASRLAGWSGARIAQDDVFAKPPSGGSPIGFHTDQSYIPWPEVTVWIALDDVSEATGTLEYVRGSHLWAPSAPKVAADAGQQSQHQQPEQLGSGFHQPSGHYRSAMHAAARAHGLSPEAADERVVKVSVPAGGSAFHLGGTWHGSDVNSHPSAWRRTLAIHLIPAHSDFKDKNVGYIYGRYKLQNSDQMDESFFPVLWPVRSAWLSAYCKDALTL